MQLVNLTPIQIRLYNDKQHRFIVIPSGRRSRKTLIGMKRLLIKSMNNKYHRYFFGAPTRDQAKKIFWKRLKDWTTYLRKDKSDSELFVRLLNETEIHVVGLDKPERIEGQPWDGCHITEIGNVKEGAWGENIRPVLSDTNGWAYLDGVPEGMNHYYDMALKAAGGILPKTEHNKGSYSFNPDDPDWAYYHWFSSDVLPPEEIEAAKRDLDPRTYRQEYEGSYESYEGLAYWAFSKKNLKKIEYNPKEIVHIGMDFNVNPMTAVFSHIRSDDIYQFGEAFLLNSNTFEMANHLNNLFNVKNCIIYPDSTGYARESNATESDIAILRRNGFRINAHRHNPFIIDRVNAVNAKIKDGLGNPHYFVDPEKCPKTINDFNKREQLSDGRLNKEQEKSLMIGHITDALGYKIAYLYPVIKREFGSFNR